jgi:hypothetical protein
VQSKYEIEPKYVKFSNTQSFLLTLPCFVNFVIGQPSSEPTNSPVFVEPPKEPNYIIYAIPIGVVLLIIGKNSLLVGL